MESKVEERSPVVVGEAQYREVAQGNSVGTAVRRRWPLVLLVTLATMAGAFWYVEGLPPTYTAKAIVVISPRPSAGYVAPTTITLAASKYVALVEGPQTIDAVAKREGEDAGAVRKAISASVETNTGNITLAVTWSDARTAAHVANAFAKELVAATTGESTIVGETVSNAVPPSQPSGPPRRAMEAASVVMGLALGLGLALALERLRPKIETRSDIERLAGPILAEFPSSRRVSRRPLEAFAEPDVGTPARHLRTNLEAKLPRRPNVICVTSPARGDGKTTVSAMLAEAFARKGERTLLVDADLHASRAAAVFGVRRTQPMSSMVRDASGLADAVQAGWVDNLWVVSPSREGGQLDIIATTFPALLEQARAAYPVTIVDMPPLIGVDDARVAAPATDGVLLVVSAGTSPDVVHEAVLALEMVDAPYLGAVANRWKVRAKSYYYA